MVKLGAVYDLKTMAWYGLMQDPQLSTEQAWMAVTNPNAQQPNQNKTASLYNR